MLPIRPSSSSLLFALLVAICVGAAHGITSTDLSDLDDGIYRFELCGGRSACGSQPEYLAFNNKTCDAGVPPKSATYGNTVGPLLRTEADSKTWKRWKVSVLSRETKAAIAALTNWVPKGRARCSGHYLSDYYKFEGKQGCTELPWSERVHLHKPLKRWRFVPVAGTECFNIIDADKPANCLRYLSASGSCSEKYMKLTATDDGSGLQRWRLIREGSSPSPSPSPTPTPTPKASPPHLLTVAASGPSSGTILFEPTPGAVSCTVALTLDGKTTTSTVTALSFPTTTFFPVNLVPDATYSVRLQCRLPSGLDVPDAKPASLHTPPNEGDRPAAINFIPGSSTSANLTIVPPAGCVPASYQVSVNGTVITSVNSVVAIEGLTPGKTYAVQATVTCADGQQTGPSATMYVTPKEPNSTVSPSPPPPSPKNPSPSPSGGKSPSPGSSPSQPSPSPSGGTSPSPGSSPSQPSPSPSGGKSPLPSPTPLPPALVECTAAPGLNIVAVSGSLVTVEVTAPPPVANSQVAIAAACTYDDGTTSGEDKSPNWIPASDPVTSFQVHVAKPGKCEVVVAVQQLGQVVPVLCPIEDATFEVKALQITPGLQNVQPPSTSGPATVQIVEPTIGCQASASYTISAQLTGSSSPPKTFPVTGLSATLTGLPAGQYQLTVEGACPDGTKTPASTPVAVSISCTTAGQVYNPQTGSCALSPSPPPLLPSPPPPSPPVLVPVTPSTPPKPVPTPAPTTPAVTRKCYECDLAAPELCESLYQETTCTSPNEYCITFVDNKADGSRVVTRGCGNYDRCFSDWYQGTSDEDTCREKLGSTQLLEFTCTFCCVVDNCNDNLRPVEDTLFTIT